jgi:transcriptional regulator with XRE-family HTH domain
MTGSSTPRYCRCGTRLGHDHSGGLCSPCEKRLISLRAKAPEVPADFWETEQLRDAFAAQHIGQVSRAYRKHPHHVAVYGRDGIPQTVVGDWLGLTQAQISRIENGSPVRHLDNLAHWARSLRIPDRCLWFKLPTHQEHEPSRLDIRSERAPQLPSDPAQPGVVIIGADGQEQNDSMRRRTFLLGGMATLGTFATTKTRAASSRSLAIRCADEFGFATAVTDRWPATVVSRLIPAEGTDWRIRFPAGRIFDGAEVTTQVHASVAQPGGVALVQPERRRLAQFTRPRQRGLLVAAADTVDAGAYYALDARESARQAIETPDNPTITIPRAYLLDDLTYGVMWAMTSLDDAVLADDGPLHAHRQDLAHYEGLTGSTVSREEAGGLATISQMWLGSDFCARHIVRNLGSLEASPLFWTREQRGEEASTWLLWRHKVAYLQRTSSLGTPVARGFCLPEQLVDESPRHERVLLLLSAALMESFGIRVCVTPEPAYGEVEGFVLGGHVIVANWIRTPGLWHVDTRNPGDRSRFSDTAGQVTAHSVIDGATPRRRLMALAAYLRIPWKWFHSRCAELGAEGFTRLAAPRSRLLTVDGLNLAAHYVGQLSNL